MTESSPPAGIPAVTAVPDGALLYLDLLKGCLTRSVVPERWTLVTLARVPRRLFVAIKWAWRQPDLELVRTVPPESSLRDVGLGWPVDADTMIGMERLNSLQDCVTDVVLRGVPGDLLETGVWRGGACIFMRGILKALGDEHRKVWLADSFAGLPKPDIAKYPADEGDRLWKHNVIAVSRPQVEENFRRYGLLDNQVGFIVGWFEDTLASAPVERLSVLRLDGDMYGSTIVALRHLYPKLSPGGYLVVDDYGARLTCRQAVDDYRAEYDIRDEIREIDWTGVYWQKS